MVCLKRSTLRDQLVMPGPLNSRTATSQARRDLNPQHAALETAALPFELRTYVDMTTLGQHVT